jgi:hypothetical protein
MYLLCCAWVIVVVGHTYKFIVARLDWLALVVDIEAVFAVLRKHDDLLLECAEIDIAALLRKIVEE